MPLINNEQTGPGDIAVNFDPPALGSTHCLHYFPTSDIDMLFRASDGIMIAQRKRLTVVLGESPNTKTSRVFRDAMAAKKYIRTVPAVTDILQNGGWWGRFLAWLLGDPLPVFHEVNVEQTLVMPGDIDIPQLFR